MKLTTKIAGSMALPLALAVAANSAQAFTVVDNDDHTIAIGGYLSAITSWSIPDEGDENNQFSAGNSRLNLGYTDKATGTKFFYEQQFVGGLHVSDDGDTQSNGLRHAYFETADGMVAGYTWSFGTNLVALAETIDTWGNGNTTYQVGAPRNLLLGQRFTVADGMKVGVSLEDQNNNVGSSEESVVPAVTVNFDGQFGDARVFAAWTNFAVNDGADKDKRSNRLTLGSSIDAGAANIKLGVTHVAHSSSVRGNVGDITKPGTFRNAEGTHVSGALGFKVNEKVRTNLVVEHSMYDKKGAVGAGESADATSVWLNAFYQADNGVEWGGELQYVDADDNVGFNAFDGALGDGDMAIRLQAKYAF